MKRSRLAAIAALSFTFAAGRAQDGLDGTVRTVDGRTQAGVITVAADGAVRVRPAQGDAVQFAFADLMAIEPSAPPAPVAAAGLHRVLLRSGAELPATGLRGELPTGKPPQLVVTLPGGATCSLPLQYVAALRLRRDGAPSPATFDADLQAPSATQDYLYVDNEGKGQRFSVTVEGLAGTQLRFQLGGQTREFALDGVLAIVFGKGTGFAPDRQGRPRTAVSLASGHVLEGRLLQLAATCRLRLDEGAEVDLPLAAVARLSIATDKLTWLSELKPVVEQVPAFDRTWPWSNDRTAAGPGIRLGGKNYSRGVAMVPRTRLTYDLGGKYDTFDALLGIDERGGPQAHAILRVLVDGKVAFESEPMTLGKAPVAVHVPLGKCKSLAIEADFGKNFDLGDLCVFADARVVQQ